MTRALDEKYCDRIESDEVKRIFNDYNYGETLIYEGVSSFIDARVDLFADNIFKDAVNLIYLTDFENDESSFNPEEIIDKYRFDAIIIQSDRPLKAYLDSHSEKYTLIAFDSDTSYYHVNRYFNIKE